MFYAIVVLVICLIIIMSTFSADDRRRRIADEITRKHRAINEQIKQVDYDIAYTKTQRLRDIQYQGFAEEVKRTMHLQHLEKKKEDLLTQHAWITSLRDEKDLDCIEAELMQHK